MTTNSQTQGAEHDNGMRRILNATRLHFVNPFPTMVLPLLIMGFIFLANLVIWWLIFNSIDPADAADATEGMRFSGSTSFWFVYMLVVAVQAMNNTFPFALGLSVTRRDFYLGSALAFVLFSLYYATILAVLAAVERATDGWFFGGVMFDVIYFTADNPLLQFLLFFMAFLFFFFIGAATAAVYVRWRANGMYVFFAALVLILVGIAAITTTTNSWPAVGQWFVTNGAVGVATWSLLPTVLAAVVGFFILRRATPRS